MRAHPHVQLPAWSIKNTYNLFKNYLTNQAFSYHASDNFSKHNVLAVEPSGSCQENEELGTIRVFSVVCHGNHTNPVAQDEVFIYEFVTIDTLS